MAGGVLLLDLGNRRLKAAMFRRPGGHGPVQTWTLAESLTALPAVAAEAAEVRLSSTNPAFLPQLLAGPLAAKKLHQAGPGNWPISVHSQGTGSDRVLAAFAAWSRNRLPCLVADLGTAWTLDVVDGSGEFRGGAIGAGLGLQEAALSEACPHLGTAAEDLPADFARRIPETTAQALASGLAGHLAAGLEAQAKRFEAALGQPCKRFYSGGDGPRLQFHLGPDWEGADDLVLEGLSLWAPT
ncbi:MAG: type III pantothenate kinase [Planctomycetota bacterium]|nr:MAG: type III pantothenate kinase [Planctomycetota bacterium]